jgi:hypothetical protein
MSHHPPARGASPVRPAYRRPFICAASIALSLGFAPHATLAADGTWTRLDGGISIGLWSDPTAWLNGIIADGDGATANFATPDIIGPSVISLDTSRTIGNLTFGDSDPSTPANWTLDNGGNPANTLTLSTVLMNGTVGHTYLGDTVLKSRVETTNVANAILTVFGDPSNSVVFDGGYFRIFNTTTSTSAGTLANNLIVNTTGTIEYSGRSSTTGVLTGNGTLNVITHFVRSDNGGNWSGFTGIFARQLTTDFSMPR